MAQLSYDLLPAGSYAHDGQIFRVKYFKKHLFIGRRGEKAGYMDFANAKNCRPYKNLIMTGRDQTGRSITRIFINGKFAFDSTMRLAF